MPSLESYLKPFDSITLDELDRVNFSDRQDSKAVFHVSLLPELLEKISPFYNILDIRGLRCFRYESLYFDTPSLKLYNDHHRGKGHRYKLRFRKYLDNNVSFFEIKIKNNKGRNVKTRLETSDISTSLSQPIKTAIRHAVHLDPELLTPTLAVSLNRITLVHRDSSEKVTFDLDIHFKFSGETKSMNGLVIAEVKQKKYNPESDFLKIQHQLHIRSSSVSKYCLGMATLNRKVKTNRFKAGITRLEKIIA